MSIFLWFVCIWLGFGLITVAIGYVLCKFTREIFMDSWRECKWMFLFLALGPMAFFMLIVMTYKDWKGGKFRHGH